MGLEAGIPSQEIIAEDALKARGDLWFAWCAFRDRVRALTADIAAIKKHSLNPEVRRALDQLAEACLRALGCLAQFEGRKILDNALSLDAARQVFEFGEARFQATMSALASSKRGESEAPPTAGGAIS
jgi:hypothetical protein